MKNKRVLKWTNKYSGETGYVGTVSKKKGYFTNEPDTTISHYFRLQIQKEMLKKYMENQG